MTSTADFQLRLTGDFSRSARESAAAANVLAGSLGALKKVSAEQSRSDREAAQASIIASRARRESSRADLAAVQVKVQEARLSDLTARQKEREARVSGKQASTKERGERNAQRAAEREAAIRQRALDRQAAAQNAASKQREREEKAVVRGAAVEARGRQRAEREQQRSADKVVQAEKRAAAERQRSVDRQAASRQGLERQRQREEQAEQRARSRQEREQQRAAAKLAKEQKKEAKKRAAEETEANEAIKAGHESANKMLVGGFALAAAGALVLVSAVAKVGEAVGRVALDFAQATAEAIDFGTKSRLALTRLTGSAEVGTRAFDETRAEAERLGLDVEQTQGRLTQLMGANFSLGLSQAIIKVGADLDATGGSAEGFADVLERVKDVGSLGSRDLKALQKAGIAPTVMFTELAKATGKSEKELKKLLAAGKIKADVGIAAALRAGMKESGSQRPGDVAAERAATTFEGMRAKVKAAWKNTLIDIGNAVGPVIVPIVGKLAAIVTSIIKSPAIAAAGKRLLERFQAFGAWVDANMPKIQAVATGAIDAIVTGIDALSAVFAFFQEDTEAANGALVAIKATALLVALSIGTVVLAVVLLAAAFLIVPVTLGLLTFAVQKMVKASKAQIRDLLLTIVDLTEKLLVIPALIQLVTGEQSTASKIKAKMEARDKANEGKKPPGERSIETIDQAKALIQAKIAGGVPANDNSARLLGLPRAAIPQRTAAVTQSRSVQSLQPVEQRTNVNAPVTVNVQTSSDDPQTVGNEVGKGVQGGLLGAFQKLAS